MSDDRPSFEKQQPSAGGQQPPTNYAPPPGYGPQPGYGPPPYGYPPAPYGYGPPPQVLPPHEKPPSHIGWAIGAIFAFWPLAIPAFIFAGKVDDLWFRGDRAGAQKASHDARLYGMIGVIIGVVAFVVGILLIIFVFVFFASAVDHVNDIPTFTPTLGPS